MEKHHYLWHLEGQLEASQHQAAILLLQWGCCLQFRPLPQTIRSTAIGEPVPVQVDLCLVLLYLHPLVAKSPVQLNWQADAFSRPLNSCKSWPSPASQTSLPVHWQGCAKMEHASLPGVPPAYSTACHLRSLALRAWTAFLLVFKRLCSPELPSSLHSPSTLFCWVFS